MILQNLSTLLDDPRRRNVISVTLLLLLTMLLIGSIRLFHQIRGKHLPGSAKIESMRPIGSVPGGMKNPPTQAYIKLQMEQNRQKAEYAKKTGRSAIATIVDGFPLTPDSSASLQEQVLQKHSTPSPLMSEADRAMANHENFMFQHQTELTKQQMQSAMHQQMNQLFNAWSHASTPEQVVGIEDTLSLNEQSHDDLNAKVPALIKAGDILQAVLLTTINTDEPSPVLAQVTTGQFKDARLIGSLSRVGERLLVQFHTINLPKNAQALSIDALAVDETIAKTSLASHVDRHSLLRYGSFAAACLFQGSGATLQHAGNRLIHSRVHNAKPGSFLLPAMTGTLLSATGSLGTNVGSELAQQLYRPPTVSVQAGIAIGVLFMSNLADPSPSKA